MKKLVLSGLALGAAIAVGTAQAEPLSLSAAQMDEVTAGHVFDDFKVSFAKKIDVEKRVKIEKEVRKFQDVFVFGFFSEADAFATCRDGAGFGCQAVTEAVTDVDSKTGIVRSASLSESATSGFAMFANFGE